MALKGYRKLIIGLAFLGCSTFLTYAAITEKAELTGIASVILTISGGVGVLTYGNVQEHRANGKPSA